MITKHNISHRAANYDDLKAIARIHVESWQAAYKNIVSQDCLDSLDVQKRLEMWQSVFPTLASEKKCLLVAEHDQKIIGFATTGPARDSFLEFTGELYAIYLDPDFYGKGLGQELFKLSVNHLIEQNIGSMYLWVLSKNPQARHFYEKMSGQAYPEHQKTIQIGTQSLAEIVYGWPKI